MCWLLGGTERSPGTGTAPSSDTGSWTGREQYPSVAVALHRDPVMGGSSIPQSPVQSFSPSVLHALPVSSLQEHTESLSPTRIPAGHARPEKPRPTATAV